MTSIRAVPAAALISATATALKGMPELEPPAWAAWVKSGVSRERPPAQPDWWWIRAAALLRRLYLGRPAGVSRLRWAYGGRKNRGSRPERVYPAGGAHIRRMLQQLERAGLVKSEKGKGRSLTPKGKAFLKKIASGIKQ